MLTYARTLVRSAWRLPAPPDARPAGPADYALVAIVGAMGVVEVALLRPDMDRRWLALVAFLVWLPGLLVRRTRPLLLAVAFTVASTLLVVLARIGGAATPDDVNTAVVALLIPYSLTRWARGRDAVIGLALFLLVATISLITQDLAATDRIGGASVVIASAAIGAVLRARALLHSRQLDDVRTMERERLARDLHDTVAHHLTAIAITAQAGLAVAATRPEAAADALRRIDEEATRTLAETRTVLRMLRSQDEVPTRPLDDLAGLASSDGPGPRVEVRVADGVDLSPTVAAAVHRIAQEAVANARRHGVDTTSVRVSVNKEHSDVVLTVTNDGRTSARSTEGFGILGLGILGMAERAALLGGHLEAGPAPGGGWKVTAVLPGHDERKGSR